MKFTRFAIAALLALLPLTAHAAPRNIVIFVADGLRYGSVEPGNMPNLAKAKAEGVDFTNSHALYPTFTTVNASAIATGHYIGDTGNFGNVLWTGGKKMYSLGGATAGFLENDLFMSEFNAAFGGNYLGETSLMAAARAAGFQTAVLGKEGPSRIQDVTAAQSGEDTLILDDATGHAGGIGLPQWFRAGMKQAFLGAEAPKAAVPDIEQEVWLMKAATRIVLPHFKDGGKPFVLLFWSRDPDFSQHNGKDSVGEFEPGINGPTGHAGTRDADTMFGELMAALKAQGLDQNTDVFITADHGFATISRASASSPSAHFDPLQPLADMPQGFLASDLAATFGLPMFDPDRDNASVDFSNGGKSVRGSGLLGADPDHPDIMVAANGGSDLVYLPGSDAKERAPEIVKFLSTQDYVSGIFVNDRLGNIPGTLPMSAVGLTGAARTPAPDLYVNFRSFAGNCADPLMCTIEIGDTPLSAGQGMHGSFSRAETRNFMAAIGPDFKKGYADPAPVSNADIAPTMAHLAGIALPAKGKLKGRVIGEALAGGAAPQVQRLTVRSDPGEDGVRTIVNMQQVGEQRYFDAGGYPGKTVGLVP